MWIAQFDELIMATYKWTDASEQHVHRAPSIEAHKQQTITHIDIGNVGCDRTLKLSNA